MMKFERYSNLASFTLLAAIAAVVVSGCSQQPYKNIPYSQGPDDGFSVKSERASVKTSRVGHMMYLKSTFAGETAVIGIDTAWGGAITLVSLNGENFVNAHDTGRNIQPALYDGAQQYTCYYSCPHPHWGWDPVLAGDWYGHVSRLLKRKQTKDSLYTRTQPLEWYPDNKGGGAKKAVLSDTYFEQTVTAVAGVPLAFKIHYKLTHFGTDQHYSTHQEFPAVYTNDDFTTLANYGGKQPWTSAPVSVRHIADGFAGMLYSTESWNQYVDSKNLGVAVYVPWSTWVLPAGFPGVDRAVPVGELGTFLAFRRHLDLVQGSR